MSRYFLDTNVIISGLLWEGNERGLIESCADGRLEIVSSEFILKEMERVLTEKFGYAPFDVLRVINHVGGICSELVGDHATETSKIADSISDKKDVAVVAGALASNCILVTGDKRLAKDAKRFVKIMTVKEVRDGLK
jgi:putative PIN family toxin of toxin-antitoxin system